MPQVAALNAYWRDHPPVHLLVAAFMGLKPKGGKGELQDATELIKMFGVKQ